MSTWLAAAAYRPSPARGVVPDRNSRGAWAVAARAACAAFFLSIFMVSGWPAQAADRVGVRAGVHSEFARIVFDWPAPVGFDASISGRQLTVRFDRALEADFGAVHSILGQFVNSVAAGPDGLIVRFELTGDYGVKSARYENSVVVDLLTGNRGKTALTRVGVRVGEHAGFTRVVFDWPRGVPYKVNKENDRVTISFARHAEFNLSRFRSRPPRYVRSASSSLSGNWVNAGFEVVPGTEIRHFRDGSKIVLDILAGKAQVAAASPPRAAVKGPRQLVRPGAQPKSTKAGPDREAPSAASAASPPSDKAEAAEAAARTPVRIERSAPISGPEIRLQLASIRGGLTMTFPWTVVTSAAVVHRAGNLWVTFGQPATINLSAITPEFQNRILSAEQIGHEEATVLRFKLAEGLKATVTRKDTAWVIAVGERAAPPIIDMTPIREFDLAGSARIFVQMVDVGPMVTIHDPEVGDTFMILPVTKAGKGLAEERFFAEFHLLSSYQGAAVLPLADKVRISRRKNGVRVSAEGGLVLSDSKLPEFLLAGRRLRAAESEAEGVSRLIDFVAWRRGRAERFYHQRALLLRALAAAPRGGRTGLRWSLARLYFSHDMAPETIGILDILLEDDPLVMNDPTFRLVRGATNYLLGRFDEAAADLSLPALREEPDAASWRAAVAVRREDWNAALADFKLADPVLIEYPDAMRIRLRLDHAAVASEKKDAERLKQILDDLESMLGLTQSSQAIINYYRGRLAEMTEDTGKALAFYDQVVKSRNGPMMVRARLAAAELQVRTGEMTLTRQLEVMEQLRHSWRGGDFELFILRRLGQLYFQTGNSPSGLKTLRQAITYFPDSEASQDIAHEMNEEFKNLYVEGGADRMAPVTALALYYDFRELTPVGEDGDEMIRKLADRLVAVDLLMQAAELLDHQVTFRLNALEKAQVGARLALIYLFNRQPEEALRILNNTARPLLPFELEERRRHLEARAFDAMGQGDQALEILIDDESEEAQRLRADIHWSGQNWPMAAVAIEEILNEAWQRADSLTEFELAEVMRLVVTLSLAVDRDGLDRIRDLYEDKMEGTPEAASFRILTSNIDPRTIRFRQLSGTIATLDTLQTFMERYREKLAQGGSLSAMN